MKKNVTCQPNSFGHLQTLSKTSSILCGQSDGIANINQISALYIKKHAHFYFYNNSIIIFCFFDIYLYMPQISVCRNSQKKPDRGTLHSHRAATILLNKLIFRL
jgi:hypothetical protein